MRAHTHTERMLRWWWAVGISVADLAVRRREGAMIWHRGVCLRDLPLGWARAENAHGGEVYIRPARGRRWPAVFLDDLAVAVAQRAASRYDCLVVHTSPEGGCQLWLRCDAALDEEQRCRAQRWLAGRVGADVASTSGEHLGRLAGFRSWKRGSWVNVLDEVRRHRAWTPRYGDRRIPGPSRRCQGTTTRGADTSPSGREWGWVCALLEAGCEPSIAYRRLVESARPRRGRDAERYARRTVLRAQAHLAAKRTTRQPRERGLTSRPS